MKLSDNLTAFAPHSFDDGGLSKSETALALWENGVSSQLIAQRVGSAVPQVRSLVYNARMARENKPRDNGLNPDDGTVARVRSYLQENLGCMQVEVSRALDLDRRTVSRAIKIIRGRV